MMHRVSEGGALEQQQNGKTILLKKSELRIIWVLHSVSSIETLNADKRSKNC
jgi:hypothetical protein